MQLFQNGTQVANLPAPNPAAGTPGYANNQAPGLGVSRTNWDGDIANAVVAELANVVTGTGLTLSSANRGQVLDAIRRLSHSNVTFVTASITLTPEQAGLVIILPQATTPIVITLPPTGSVSGPTTGGAVSAFASFRFVWPGFEPALGASFVTVVPSGSNTINALTGYLPPLQLTGAAYIGAFPVDIVDVSGFYEWVGCWAILTQDGGGWAHGIWVQNTAGSYSFTPPPGINSICLRRAIAGGGGGGGASGAGAYGASGGAGGQIRDMSLAINPGTTINVTIGAGGSHGAGAGATNGGAGGDTVISGDGYGSAFATVYGGPGGAGSTSGIASFTGLPPSPTALFAASIYPAQPGTSAFPLGGGAVWPAIGSSPDGIVNNIGAFVGPVPGCGGNGGINGYAPSPFLSGDGGKGSDGLVEFVW
jgi:hypothetical protein